MALPLEPPLSPLWWVNRLYKRLAERRREVEFYDAYYRGDHPLPWLAPQAREEFRRLVSMTRSNYMGLVVDSTAERVSVEGVRFGEEESADAQTWRMWKANNLDADSDKAILEALIGGCSYLLVAPNETQPDEPHMWVEHPSQAIVEFAPGTNRRVRAAGLKVWDDDWTQQIHATLFTAERIYKYQASRPTAGASTEWAERFVAREQPNGHRPNPLSVVPLVELANNPRLLTGGVSELSDITDVQDRINQTLFHRLETQEFGADPQKWGTAFPLEDDNGVPQVIEFGRNRMVTTDVAETRFGQWSSAPLDPYSSAKREDVKDVASRTRTPAQYLLGEMTNVNGETLKASESGLVSKVKQRRRGYSEGFKEAVGLGRQAAGMPRVSPGDMEIIYSNPEFRTEGELVDALVKMATLGVPYEALWERWGATPQERERWRDLATQQATAGDPFTATILREVRGEAEPDATNGA